MDPLILFAIKLLASSCLLFVFYVCLFKNKASFLSRRLFLLIIPLFSLICSIASIKTENDIAGFSISKLLERKNQSNKSSHTLLVNQESTGIYQAPKSTLQNTPNTQIVYQNESDSFFSTPKHAIYKIILTIYLAISVIILYLIIRQMRRIRVIHQSTTQQIIDGILVHFSNEIPCSFSILKKIYIRKDIHNEKLKLIIKHERQHILSYHYLDLIVVEIMLIFMWFNPLVWIIRKEIRAIHEFEVDAKLLNSGIETREYMKAILEEACSHIPILANGFHGSLTKKRFLNMKKGNCIKLKKIRTALTIPFAVILILFFSCQQSYNSESNKYEKLEPKNQLLYEVRDSNGEFELLWADELAEKVKNITSFRINGLPPVRIINVDINGNYIKDVTDEYPLRENNQKEGINYAYHNITVAPDSTWRNPDGEILPDWGKECIIKYNAKAISNKLAYINEGYPKSLNRILRIDANNKETRITFATTSYGDWCWRFTDKNTCLIDRVTGDRYMIRDIEGEEEIGRLSLLEGTKNKWFEVTRIFPPLKKDVTMVDYYAPFNNIDAPADLNGTETFIENIEIRNTGQIIR